MKQLNPDSITIEEVEKPIVIIALDLETGECQYLPHPFAGSDHDSAGERLPAQIVDASIMQKGNAYSWSMAYDKHILARMQILTKDGKTFCLIHSASKIEE